jgi:hypothetical protein
VPQGIEKVAAEAFLGGDELRDHMNHYNHAKAKQIYEAVAQCSTMSGVKQKWVAIAKSLPGRSAMAAISVVIDTIMSADWQRDNQFFENNTGSRKEDEEDEGDDDSEFYSDEAGAWEFIYPVRFAWEGIHGWGY